ncbi:UDP-N-acetylglucosamine transferase subunit [Entomophthora muscae]|uniref:UDP-N-acetylglucosamine transferase subunit n=1 Tax=Entomophthora muscae TaxID=34485 RepID=A0ACC2RS03_9FUNG|nr:UDP-N-acetylglucosamine transferase subunit [Entomophthora muscae]
MIVPFLLTISILAFTIFFFRKSLCRLLPQPEFFEDCHWSKTMASSRSHLEAEGSQKRLLCVLGSGGHTMEMIQMLKTISPTEFCPRIYLISNTDSLSRSKLNQLEERWNSSVGIDYVIYKIPRSREVGQSWFTTPFSVIQTLIVSFHILVNEVPDLVIANGPGSCVPVFLASRILRRLPFVCIPNKALRLMYIESLARVKQLSLTGRILYPISDFFIVQWPNLLKNYPKSIYRGIMV